MDSTGLRNGPGPGLPPRSRLHSFMPERAGNPVESPGITPEIWGLPSRPAPSSLSSAGLQGSSSLGPTSEPDDAWPRLDSAGRRPLNNPAGLGPSQGSVSPLRQRTAQPTRDSSPLGQQNPSNSMMRSSTDQRQAQAHLNTVVNGFRPPTNGADLAQTMNAASRASSQHRTELPGRPAFPPSDRVPSYSGYNSEATSRNNSLPPSRQGNDPAAAFSFNASDISDLLSHRHVPIAQHERPHSQQAHQSDLMFGDLPYHRRPSAPYLNGDPRSFNLDGLPEPRGTRTGSVSSSNMPAMSNPYSNISNAGQTHSMGQAVVSLDHPNLSHQLLEMRLEDGFPTLSNDHHRNPSNASSFHSTNGVSRARQDRDLFQNIGRYGNVPNGFGAGNSTTYPQPHQFPSVTSHAGYQNPQHSQYGGYTSHNQAMTQAQLLSAQRVMGQQAALRAGYGGYLDGAQGLFPSFPQNRSAYSSNPGPQVPRGPSHNGRARNDSVASRDPVITILEMPNWVQKRKGESGQTHIETMPDCKIRDVLGHVHLFCGDQQGSRFLQDKLEQANSEEKALIFREMKPNIIQFCKDPFGNYVIQKFFEHGMQEQKEQMAAQMKGKVEELSRHSYGCRCLQKAFEHILVEQRRELVRELEPHLHDIALDTQGNHVIQKVLQQCQPEDVQFILNGFYGKIFEMSNNMYACRVIQRLLEFGDEESKPRATAEITANALNLMRNPYGNYVVQHIVQHGSTSDRQAILRIVEPNIADLMVNKYASNVVERCLQYGSEDDRDRLIARLTETDPETKRPKVLRDAMTANFANYVVQRSLKTLPSGKWEAFADLVRQQIPHMPVERSRDKKLNEFERLLSEGPYCQDCDFPLGKPNTICRGMHRLKPENSPPADVNTPPLTRAQPSPTSSSNPSTNNSLFDGPAGYSSADSQRTAKQAASGSATKDTDGYQDGQ